MNSKNNLGDVVETADGSLTIRNPDIDEEYHSTAGASFESRDLYIARSGIVDYWSVGDSCRVLDVGFRFGHIMLFDHHKVAKHP